MAPKDVTDGSLHCVKVSALGFPSKNFCEDPLSNKDRRNVPSTKHFIKEQYTVKMEGRGIDNYPKAVGSFFLLCKWGLELGRRRSLMEVASEDLETPPAGAEGEILPLQGSYRNYQGRVPPRGAGGGRVKPQCKQ